MEWQTLAQVPLILAMVLRPGEGWSVSIVRAGSKLSLRCRWPDDAEPKLLTLVALFSLSGTGGFRVGCGDRLNRTATFSTSGGIMYTGLSVVVWVVSDCVLCVRLGPGTSDNVLPVILVVWGVDSRSSLVTWDGSVPMKVWGRSAGHSSSKLGSDEHFVISFLEANIFTFLGIPNDGSCSSFVSITANDPNVENVGEPSGWKAVEVNGFAWTQGLPLKQMDAYKHVYITSPHTQ